MTVRRAALSLGMCRLGVRAVAWVVPAPARHRWRQEWDAEFVGWWGDDAQPVRSAMSRVRRASVALRDAFDARSQQRSGGTRPSPEAAASGATGGPGSDYRGPRRPGNRLDDLGRDVRFGIRSLWRQPGFALVGIMTIGLGIAANTTIFSLVNGILLQPLAFPAADNIVVIWPDQYFSHSGFERFDEASTVYESVAVVGSRGVIEINEDGARMLYGPRVTSGFFAIIGVDPALGRGFAAGEDHAGADDVIVISHGLWQREFGGDRQIIGRRLSMSGTDRTIIGVMPEGFSLPLFAIGGSPEVIIPQDIDPGSAMFTSGDWKMIARLRPGVSIDAAQSELQAIVAGWREEAGLPPEWGADANVVTLKEFVVGDVRPTLLLLFGAVGFTLLIATANVANLLLARALSRQHEVSMRLALGAKPSRLVRQLLTESTLLGAAGIVPGLLASIFGLSVVVGLLPADTPRLEDVRVDGAVLGFCIAAALITGWLVGLVPAVQVVRTNLRDGLTAGGRSATDSRRRQRLRVGIVAAEIALTVMLLAGAGLLVKSFWRLNQVDPGFEAAGLVKFDVFPTQGRLTSLDDMRAYFGPLEERLEAIPGVEAATTIWKAPLAPDGGITGFWRAEEERTEETRRVCRFRPITEDYFRVMGIALIEGRGFNSSDVEGAEQVAIVSRVAAESMFPDESALGKRIHVNMPGEPPTLIVGVVDDVKLNGPGEDSPATIYRPYDQSGGTIVAFQAFGRAFVVRTTGQPVNLAGQIREAVRLQDQGALISEYDTMPAAISASMTGSRVTMILLSIFTCVALLLGAIGVYGLMAYSVRSRSRELSIRVALGASRSAVLGQVLRDGLKIAMLGAVVGLALAVVVSRFLQSFVFEIGTTDPWVLAAATLMAIVMAVLATAIPALRAGRADPVEALAAD